MHCLPASTWITLCILKARRRISFEVFHAWHISSSVLSKELEQFRNLSICQDYSENIQTQAYITKFYLNLQTSGVYKACLETRRLSPESFVTFFFCKVGWEHPKHRFPTAFSGLPLCFAGGWISHLCHLPWKAELRVYFCCWAAPQVCLCFTKLSSSSLLPFGFCWYQRFQISVENKDFWNLSVRKLACWKGLWFKVRKKTYLALPKKKIKKLTNKQKNTTGCFLCSSSRLEIVFCKVFESSQNLGWISARGMVTSWQSLELHICAECHLWPATHLCHW